MYKREDIIREARSWIGTPFQHQGRIKGVGVDCVGLVIMTARNLGLSTFEIKGYRRMPVKGTEMIDICDGLLERITKKDLLPADIVTFAVENRVQHMGFFSLVGGRPSIIHSWVGARTKGLKGRGWCVEVGFVPPWSTERYMMGYRIPGLLEA